MSQYAAAIAIINQTVQAEGQVTDFAYIEHGMAHGTYDELNEAMNTWVDAQTDRALEPTIGDRVRIYHSERYEGRIVRTLQPGEYVIARENRHGDWTVRDTQFGTTHDVFRADVELV